MNQITLDTNRLLLIWSYYEAGGKLQSTRKAAAVPEEPWVADNKGGEQAEHL